MAKHPGKDFLTDAQRAVVSKAKSTVSNAKNNSPQSTGGVSTGAKPDAFLSSLQSKLLGQSDLISSANTNLETKINEAIGGIQKASDASSQRITSQFDREIAFQGGQFDQQKTSVLEGQRGFGQNRAAIQQLDERTEKSLRDLEQRKQEMLLAGEANAASAISDMQFKALEFQQKAQQDYFNNILNAGNFGIGLQNLQTSIQRENRLASSSQIQQELDRERFDFTKASTLKDQQFAQQRINIQSSELKLKQIKEGLGLNPDPGFATVAIQNTLGSLANEKLSRIESLVESGGGSETAKAERRQELTIQAFQEMRRDSTTSQATDDAIANLLGLQFDNANELNFPNINIGLPGGESGALDFLSGSVQETTAAVQREGESKKQRKDRILFGQGEQDPTQLDFTSKANVNPFF